MGLYSVRDFGFGRQALAAAAWDRALVGQIPNAAQAARALVFSSVLGNTARLSQSCVETTAAKGGDAEIRERGK